MTGRMPALMRRWFIGSLIIAASLPGSCKNSGPADTMLQIIGVASPAAPGSRSPHLAVTPTGEAVMSWLEPTRDEAHAVRYSILQDNTWSAPVTVAQGTGWFVNWADFPSVVPITAQQWAAHWLVKQPGGTYSYDIALSTSADGGTSWADPRTPHTDGTRTEHGFVTMFPWSGGIGAVWLDGRNMAPDTGSGPRPAAGNEHGGMTLRFARFGYDGERLDDGEIDDLVCDCCQTDVAVTSAGPVVAYRNRTATEFRDIAVTRYVDGGWAEPVLVDDSQWHIPGCPVNGPAIAAAGKLVVLAWYGAPERQSRVKLAWSQDAGKTFSAPVIVDETNVTGRVDVVLLSGGSALVSWMGKSGEGIGQIRMREVTVEGERGPIQLIAEGRYSRNTGFPQMVRAGDRLVYAWPEPGKPRQVRTAFSPLGDG